MLKAELRALRQPTTGRKADLLARLRTAHRARAEAEAAEADAAASRTVADFFTAV